MTIQRPFKHNAKTTKCITVDIGTTKNKTLLNQHFDLTNFEILQ
jgi:hypothetical protein